MQIPGWGNVSAANYANLLRFLPDFGHMTDGFDRQASHLRILRACLVTQVMNALLEWMHTPTHSAGLAASGVMPMTPETVCAIIRRVYRRSREPQALDAFLATAETENPGHLTDFDLDEPGDIMPEGLSDDERLAWEQASTDPQDCEESCGRFCMHWQ